MPSGGARPGAGRKPGSKNRKTRKVAETLVREGITPLEVMIEAMRAHYRKGRLGAAAAVAKDAAPYMHPRLQAIQHSGDRDNPVVVDAVDRPPEETREQWTARRARELAAQVRAIGGVAGSSD